MIEPDANRGIEGVGDIQPGIAQFIGGLERTQPGDAELSGMGMDEANAYLFKQGVGASGISGWSERHRLHYDACRRVEDEVVADTLPGIYRDVRDNLTATSQMDVMRSKFTDYYGNSIPGEPTFEVPRLVYERKRAGDLLQVLEGNTPDRSDEMRFKLALSLVVYYIHPDTRKPYLERLYWKVAPAVAKKHWPYSLTPDENKELDEYRRQLKNIEATYEVLVGYGRFPKMKEVGKLKPEFWASRIDPEYYLRAEEERVLAGSR